MRSHQILRTSLRPPPTNRCPGKSRTALIARQQPRSARAFRQSGGDGIGPDGVWRDDHGPGIQGGAKIVEVAGLRLAEIPTGMDLAHQSKLVDPHSYLEIEFQPRCTQERPNPPDDPLCAGSPVNYRVDAKTRGRLIAGSLYTYLVQALYEPDWAGQEGPTQDPTIRLFRASGPPGGELSGELLFQAIVEGSPAFSEGSGLGCKVQGVSKSPTASDVLGLRNDATKLRRVGTENAADRVMVHVMIAWSCASGTCDSSCRWRHDDFDVSGTHPLYDISDHEQGVFVHHWDLGLTAFRAGSRPE